MNKACISIGWLLLLSGCGLGQDQTLRGTVTLDGEPLASGIIQFVPQPGAKGPSAGGEIRDGQFVVQPSQSTLSGTFRVQITSVRKTGRKMRTTWGETTDEQRNFIPARYNDKSELTVEVKAGGPTVCDFALKSA